MVKPFKNKKIQSQKADGLETLYVTSGMWGLPSFVQMIILEWPWLAEQEGQIWFLMHLNCFCFFPKVDSFNTIQAEVIILTWNVKRQFQRSRFTIQSRSLILEAHQYIKTQFSQKPLGQLNTNFQWRLLKLSGVNINQVVMVTSTRWRPRPYKGTTSLNIFYSGAKRPMAMGLCK